MSGHHLILKESPKPFDQVEVGRVGGQINEFDIGLGDMFPHDFSMIVTGIIQDKKDAFGFGMGFPDLVYQFLQGLAIDVISTPNVQVLLIQRTVSAQDIVSFATGVTPNISASPLFGPDITSVNVMSGMDGIQMVNPVLRPQPGRARTKKGLDALNDELM